MVAVSDIIRRPSRMFRDTSQWLAPSRRQPQNRYAIGGVVLLALTVMGLIWLWPELQRYMRIRRM
jgi:hypothetical protein